MNVFNTFIISTQSITGDGMNEKRLVKCDYCGKDFDRFLDGVESAGVWQCNKCSVSHL
jgi:ribosomal protein L37AE/L43A